MNETEKNKSELTEVEAPVTDNKKPELTEAEVPVSDSEKPEGTPAEESEESTSQEETDKPDGEETAQEAKKKPCLFIRILKFIIPWKGDGVGDVIRKFIFIASLVVFIVTLVPLLTDVYEMHKDEKISQEIAQIYIPDVDPEVIEKAENEGKPLPSFESLLAINSDVVGYIQIDGTSISYPVVKGQDNDFYLTHDIYKNVNKSGTVMMDYRNEVSKKNPSDNYVLYGHNMAIGTYFAGLNEYWRTLYDSYEKPSMSMYKEHPVITFNTLYDQSKWKIFAIGLYNTNYSHGEVFDYIDKHDFTSREDFNNYIIEIMDRSDIFTDVDLQYGDQILTLSTCVWPYPDNNFIRLGVFARKIRDGESEKVNVEVAKVNAGVKRWKWVYDYIAKQMGNQSYEWFYSGWDRSKLLSYTKEDAKKDGYTFPSQ